ncbi:MAG TPA: tRNA lysidine(34) synthetase TilS [bacterium]
MVDRTVRDERMLSRAKKILIAFSAGPDSVCLLDALHRLYGHKVAMSLVYLDHGLRSERAISREKKLARHYAHIYGIPGKVIRIKVDAGKGRLGIEGEARESRYQALIRRARAVKADRIALGHNLDDVVETFFLNILRGSGATGLMAIPAVRLPFIRPLIAVRKRDIIVYLRQNKLRSATDRSNRRLSFRRNFLRHKVIPLLETINPRLHEHIRNQIELLRRDEAYFQQKAESALKRVVTQHQSGAALDTSRLMRYTMPVRSRALRLVIKSLCGDLAGYESKHIDAIAGLIAKESGKKIILPKGMYAQRDHGLIVIGRAGQNRAFERTLGLRGKILLPGGCRIKSRTVRHYDLSKRIAGNEVFDLDKLALPMVVRSRRPGDVLEGARGRIALKKILSAARVPQDRRPGIIVLADQKGILWIPGVKRAVRAYIGRTTKRFLLVTCECLDQRGRCNKKSQGYRSADQQ